MIFNILVAILVLKGPVVEASEWTYDDPSHWTGLCQTGKQQSPIDLITSDTKEKIYSAFRFENYSTCNDALITNNGHSVAIYLYATNPPTVSGGGLIGEYILDHFHFHWECEHTVNGYRYPLEMHLVHYSSRYANLTEASEYAGGIAVFGILFQLSLDDDVDFIPLIEVMEMVDKYPDTQVNLTRTISAKSFLPRNTAEYYRYTGSLTTPSCNEGVIWTVFSNTLPISADQVEHFEAVWSKEGPLVLNYRSTQPLNGRVVSFRNSPKSRTGSTAAGPSSSIILIFTVLCAILNL